MKNLVSYAALAAAVFAASPTFAATVFTENFNGEVEGLNVPLTQFSVMGSIDLISAGNTYGILVTDPASGNIVDINGTGASGSILSIPSFSFNAGDQVRLMFDVGGSQRGAIGDTFVTTLLFGGDTIFSALTGTGLYADLNGMGTSSSVEASRFVEGIAPFVTSSIGFTAESAGTLRFGFSSPSIDNIGPLLDNVSLDITSGSRGAATPAVPEPATWAMMLVGFGAIAFAMRRQQRQTVRYNFA